MYHRPEFIKGSDFSTILEHVCLSGKGEDDNVIMVMLTINDPEIHKII